MQKSHKDTSKQHIKIGHEINTPFRKQLHWALSFCFIIGLRFDLYQVQNITKVLKTTLKHELGTHNPHKSGRIQTQKIGADNIK